MNINRKSVALSILTALIFIPAKQSAQQSPPPISPKNGSLVINVAVTDKAGVPIRGLKENDFEISIDKKPARIVSLSTEDSPISVGILFDSSGSAKMAAKDFAFIQQGLREFFQLNNHSNDYFLLDFNTKPHLVVDWTSDPVTILDKFSDIHTQGNTAVYDACYVAVDKLRSGRHAQHALVLISDGQDNVSRYSSKELRQLLRETDVLFYSISFPKGAEVGSALAMEASGILDELCSLSGGMAISSKAGSNLKPKDASSAFEFIASDLRSRYAISVANEDPAGDRKWQKIKVKVNLPTGDSRRQKALYVRTREGFYAR